MVCVEIGFSCVVFPEKLSFRSPCSTAECEFDIVGVIAGIVGILLIALAYPVYKKVLKSECEKVAPEILRLSEELLK